MAPLGATLATEGHTAASASTAAPAATPAIESVVADHLDDVVAFARWRLRGAASGDLDDAVSVTFQRVARALPRYNPSRATLRTWVLGIAANVCREHLRSRARRREDAAPADEVFAEVAPHCPEADAARREELAWARRLVDSLEEPKRTAWLLFHVLDFTETEALQFFQQEGVAVSSVNTVRAWMRRANEKLQQAAERYRRSLPGE
jgi:RNA polymerase sigma factor (sigma-70 family)